ncbi:MAG: hypothetical protein JW889_16280 [Verrucomicrobia bacterium]|nr:hypothetical protein [Verrucomicrobiota bacterium]
MKWVFIVCGLLLVVVVVLVLVTRSEERTVYAPGFTWEAYAKVKPGMHVDKLTELLGPPLSVHAVEYTQVLMYREENVNPGPPSPVERNCWFVFDEAGKLTHQGGVRVKEHDIEPGMTLDELKAMLGEPDSVSANRPGRGFVYAQRDPAHFTSNCWFITILIGPDDRVVDKWDEFVTD